MSTQQIKKGIKPNNRDFKYIVIHSSGTMEGQPYTAKEIDDWHRRQGWLGIGYNIVIDLDGKVELGRSLSLPGAHCKAFGRNHDSIGICYIGGIDRHHDFVDTRTPEQKIAMEAVLQTLKAVWPDAEICGHRDFSETVCPSFNASQFYADITGETLV